MWIEPLALETWIINVFSGKTAIFTAVALFAITSLSAYFRMTGMTLVLMVGIFFIMFSGYVDQSVYFLLVSLAGLLIGYWVSKIVKG